MIHNSWKKLAVAARNLKLVENDIKLDNTIQKQIIDMNANDKLNLYIQFKKDGVLPDQMTNKVIEESLKDIIDPQFGQSEEKDDE